MLTRRGFLAAAAVTSFASGSVSATAPARMPLKVLPGTDIDSDKDAELLGVARFQPGKNSRMKAAEPVNTDKFFQEYFSVFSNDDNSSTGQMS